MYWMDIQSSAIAGAKWIPLMDIQLNAGPVAGKDYPRNWSEFLDWFASEEACASYLEKLRWLDGFVCSACAVVGEPYRSSRGRLMCRQLRAPGFGDRRNHL